MKKDSECRLGTPLNFYEWLILHQAQNDSGNFLRMAIILNGSHNWWSVVSLFPCIRKFVSGKKWMLESK